MWGMTNNLGGMEVFVKNYMSELTRYNITLDFISTTDEISIAQDVQNCGGYIYKIPSRKLNWLAYHKALKNILKVHANEYDAVWLNDCLFCNIDILKLAKKYNIKKRLYMHIIQQIWALIYNCFVIVLIYFLYENMRLIFGLVQKSGVVELS